MSIYVAPTALLNSKEFQKALADQKAFGTLLGQVFGGGKSTSEKYAEKAGRLQKMINEYLPAFTLVPKEIVADAMREVLYKSWEMAQVSGKIPDRKAAFLSLVDHLSPEQMALHDKFVQIFKSKNLSAVFQGKMAASADAHVEFLAYLLVKQADLMKKEGIQISQGGYETLASNLTDGVSNLMIYLKETKDVQKSVDLANSSMQNTSSNADAQDKKNTKIDYLSIGKGSPKAWSKKSAEILKGAIKETYAYVQIFWDYSDRVVNELEKNIFAGTKPASPSFTPAGKEALRDLFWATVSIDKDENTQRDNEVKKKHGYRKTG